jgi:SAM-dependent methyltransferase
MHTVNISVRLPAWIYNPLRRIKRALLPQNGKLGTNLWGDRDVEYSFIAANMPSGPGHALDFGCGPSNLSFLAARRGFQVLALDLELQNFYWLHDAIRFLQADLFSADLQADSLDLIINCSAVEHVGLVGRYGVSEARTDGDLEAMRRMLSLLKPTGVMLLTIPCGRDATFIPLHRVYGKDRLPQLLQGYAVQKEEYWTKDPMNRWKIADRESALVFRPTADLSDHVSSSYALGCFILRRPESAPRHSAQ